MPGGPATLDISVGFASSGGTLYAGTLNDFGSQPRTATVECSPDARVGAAPAGFTPKQVEHRQTAGQDGPTIRTAVHTDGTVYTAFQSWNKVISSTRAFTDALSDIVVVRDDSWAQANPAFSNLVDPADGAVGVRVATNRFVRPSTSATASAASPGSQTIAGSIGSPDSRR